MGEIIQLQGDQRQNVKEWLLAQEVVTQQEVDRIVIHGERMLSSTLLSAAALSLLLLSLWVLSPFSPSALATPHLPGF